MLNLSLYYSIFVIIDGCQVWFPRRFSVWIAKPLLVAFMGGFQGL